MFRKKDPQGSLFETCNLVPEAKARRLQASWAETFRARALPLIDEELFAPLYWDDNGRPNRPVQTVFAVHLLKEMFGLTDAEALEQLEFSLLWHHALELTPEEAHLPQKTLHNFRARLLAHDGGREAFAATTDRILDALGELGLEKNTYVLFTSDNGPWLIKNQGKIDGTLERDHGGSAGILRSGKVSTWEGGQRVPTVFWAPGRIRPRG